MLKESILKWMICYFKKIGYEDTAKEIEKESKIELKNIFCKEFIDNFYEKKFDNCLNIIKNVNLESNKKKYIEFELIKLKFLKYIYNKDIPNALITIRSELNEYSDFKNEIQNLCKLLMQKDNKELNSIINFGETQSLREYFLNLENYILGNNYEEILKNLLINDKKQQIIDCKYHYEIIDLNLQISHICDNYKDFILKKKINNSNNEIIVIKLSKCENFIVLGFINNCFLIMKKNLSNEYIVNFKKDIKLENEEITSLNFSENSNYIAVCSSDLNIRIFDTKNGEMSKIIEKAHQDIITEVKFYDNDTKIFSSGLDNYIYFRDLNGNSSFEIKSKKVKQMKLTEDFNFIYTLNSFNKMINYIDIVNKKEFDVYEDEININCFDINKNGEFIIISRKTKLNEILLFNSISKNIIKRFFIDNLKLKNICFLDFEKKLIISMAEEGNVIIWHLNNNTYRQKLMVNMNLNSIYYINNKLLVSGNSKDIFIFEN